MKTQTQTKSAVKTATKPAPRQSSKPVLVYATMLSDALAGKFGETIKRFYINALSYHMKQKTTFPRAANAIYALLSPADALAFIGKHGQTSIPAGSKTGQRLFDEMMVETARLPKVAPPVSPPARTKATTAKTTTTKTATAPASTPTVAPVMSATLQPAPVTTAS